MPKGVYTRRRLPLAERFWRHVQKTDDCWLWTAHRDKDGYGRLKEGDGSRRTVRAPAVSWLLHCGPIHDGLWVLHKCDNPPCVRPDHLYLGTVLDNRRDAVTRNRVPRDDRHPRRLKPELWAEHQPRGEVHGRHVLTEAQAIEIIALRKTGQLTKALAMKFGVSRPTISLLLSGKTWKHLLR